VENVLWVPRLCSQPQQLRRSDMKLCFGINMCYSCQQGLAQTKQWFLELEWTMCIGKMANLRAIICSNRVIVEMEQVST
jgi:hypothetical protein